MFKIELSKVFVVKTPVKFNFLKHLLWTIIHTKFASQPTFKLFKLIKGGILRYVANMAISKYKNGFYIEVICWNLHQTKVCRVSEVNIFNCSPVSSWKRKHYHVINVHLNILGPSLVKRKKSSPYSKWTEQNMSMLLQWTLLFRRRYSRIAELIHKHHQCSQESHSITLR